MKLLNRNLIFSTLISLLFGCSSIPVSTMLKMGSMDVSTLQVVDGEKVLTRLTLQPDVSPNLDETKLELSLDTKQGERNFQFPLAYVSKSDTVIGAGMFSKDRKMVAHTLRLSEQGVADFKALQEEFSRQEPEGLGFSVKVRFNRDESHKQGIMSLELMLTEEEGFFTLLDEYEYTIGEKRSF